MCHLLDGTWLSTGGRPFMAGWWFKSNINLMEPKFLLRFLPFFSTPLCSQVHKVNFDYVSPFTPFVL